jgi:sugar phosphate isomerase/epimerase
MNAPQPLSRRNFIKTTSLALSAAALPSAGPLLAAEAQKLPAGCRDLNLKFAGQPDCWSAMKALGAESTEVYVELDLACPNLFHPQHKYSLATAAGIRTLKEDLAASGCRVTAFMMSNRFDERLEQELEAARGVVKAAQQLGVDAIRIDVVPRKLSAEQFLPFAIETCRRLCASAKGTPVRFGVENHGQITNDPQFLDKLFNGAGSDGLGLTLDTANFYWWGLPLKDLYAVYEKFAPRVVHTHCKSIHYPADKQNVRREIGWEYAKYDCPIYEGDLDFKRIVGILRQANYRGDLCVEDESLGKNPESERADIIRKEIALLKGLA